MNKKNNGFENRWNEIEKIFQNQFSLLIKMSENYGEFLNDYRKNLLLNIQKFHSSENEGIEKSASELKTDKMDGNWKDLIDDIQQHWGKLTNDNLSQINGSRKRLAGALQKNYDIPHKEAEKQLKDWEKIRAQMVKVATY